MKEIKITLTETEAIVLWKLLNLMGASGIYEKVMLVKDDCGHSFSEDFKGIEEKARLTLSSGYTIWNSLDTEMRANSISPRYEPIFVGSNKVEFKYGGAQVGDVFFSKETIEAISKRLTAEE